MLKSQGNGRVQSEVGERTRKHLVFWAGTVLEIINSGVYFIDEYLFDVCS